MNPILEQTRKAILQKADPRLGPVILSLVKAGQKVMYAEKTRQMFKQQIGDGKDPEAIGAGIAKVIGILYNQSGKKAPMQAMIPASVILLCEGLSFLEDAGAVQISPDFLAACMQALSSNVLQLFGATPEQIQGYMDKAKAGPQAPPAGPTPAPGIVAGAQGGA